MANHLTPEELSKELGIEQQEVIRVCMQEGVPIYHGKIDKYLFQVQLEHYEKVQGETLDNLAEAVAVFASDGRLRLFNPVFARLWKLAPSWRPNEARVGTWLHRVALNLCLDKLARRREEIGGEAPEAPDPGPGPAGSVQQREMEDCVRTALGTLPEAQRSAITLCHYQGMRNIEAAEVMGVSIEALESLLLDAEEGA